VRLLTSLCILGICGYGVIEGWHIARFAKVHDWVEANGSQPDRIRAGALRQWVGLPGLTSAALQGLLLISDNPSSDTANKRPDDLAALLSVRPLSAAEWLALAAIRFGNARPMGDVESALTMSYLTGPNESDVMWQRAIFGLLHWEVLPLAAHRQTIADLSGAILGHAASSDDLRLAGHLLEGKPSQARSQIAEMLQGVGIRPLDLARLGLAGDRG